MIIRTRAYARAGLAGNPSDGFFGKTISIIVKNYAAEVSLYETPRGDLVAYGRCVQQDNEIFWSDVEVASAADGRVSARGTVLYRIVT